MVLHTYFWIFYHVFPVFGSVFIGFPPRNWKTADSLCTMPSHHNIKHTELVNISSEAWLVNSTWIGSRIKYSKWTAFIGCGNFSGDYEKEVKDVNECLVYCSEVPQALYFTIQNSRCGCLTVQPQSSTKSLDCIKICRDFSNTPCGSGTSAMVFIFVTDISIQTTNKYISHECVSSNSDYTSFQVEDCSVMLRYGCTNTTGIFIPRTWYGYQKDCLKSKTVPRHNMNIISYARPGLSYWTPIFRRHLILKDSDSMEHKCLSLEFEILDFVVENCSELYPFLCTKSDNFIKWRGNEDPNLPGNNVTGLVTLSASVVGSVCVTALIAIGIIYNLRMSYETKMQELNERLAGTQFSSRDGLAENTKETEHNSGHKDVVVNQEDIYELPDDISSNNEENEIEKTDYRGYLLPEHKYHMINDHPHGPVTMEVYFHSYSASQLDTFEKDANVNIYDEDGYMEPVKRNSV